MFARIAGVQNFPAKNFRFVKLVPAVNTQVEIVKLVGNF